MDKLLTLSGVQLAGLIRNRDVSSQEIVRVHIDHVKKVNPIINALVTERFEEALAEAREADEMVLNTDPSKLPIYLGVPATIKEIFALKGLVFTGGLYARKGKKADHDATTVKRMRKAGAIILGGTNVSELCMWMETHNKIYGRTNNPYDPSRIPGGSSGGEGAIIGSGASPFGLAADVGGSIRMPAFFNGVFGHKPSSLLVPNTGQWPNAVAGAIPYLSTGPICRKAEDLMPLLTIMAGPDGVSPVKKTRLGDPSKVSISDLNVFVMEDNGRVPVSKDLKKAIREAGRALEERGAKVSEGKFPAFKNSFEMWSFLMSSSGEPHYEVNLFGGKKVSLPLEFARCMISKSEYTVPSLALVLLEKFYKYTEKSVPKWVRKARELKEELNSTLGPNGILLFPPYSRCAPKHRLPLLSPFDWQYTAVFNVLELPVTQVPLGLNAEGLPLGVQVASIHGNDHVTIAVAQELEKAFGGWVPPLL